MTSRIQHIAISSLVAAAACFGITLPAYSQNKNEEVTIIAPYIPTIQNASKIPLRPEIRPAEQQNEQFDYLYITRSVEVTTELDPIEPIKFSADKREDLYGNYVKGGFGNYTAPYLEFLASSRQNEKHVIGARFRHYSSQGDIKDYANSAFSHNLISAFGSTFTKAGTLTGEIGYNRDVVHYYGFPLDSFPDVDINNDQLKQRFQHFVISAEYTGQSKAENGLKYHAGTDFHYFNDRYDSREVQFDFNAGIDKKISSNNSDFRQSFAMDFGLEYLGFKDSLSSNSPVYIDLFPVYRFGFSRYSFEVGIKVFFSSAKDTANVTSIRFDEYPHLKAEIALIDDQLKFYAVVDGNKQINSYRSLSGNNPFISSTPMILPTDQFVRIAGGLTGHAGGFNYNVEAAYSYNDNMPLFVNDTSLELQNKFLPIYDDVNLLNINASIGILKVRGLDANLKAGFFKYIPKHEEKAWQMPSFEIGLDARYVIKVKYIVSGNLLALGTRYARDFNETGQIAVKMKPALDLSLGFEYRITDRISAWVTLNNILNQHYQRWYNYPVQGIQGMLGATFSF